jgi:hypothetical protein
MQPNKTIGADVVLCLLELTSGGGYTCTISFLSQLTLGMFVELGNLSSIGTVFASRSKAIYEPIIALPTFSPYATPLSGKAENRAFATTTIL